MPVLFFLLTLFAGSALAQPEVDRLIAGGDEPAGVVFEIIESDEEDLLWALPKIARLGERLRQRFPGLPVVVVTHGAEQFGLLASEAVGPLAPAHEAVKSLAASDIGVHVCGVHASWQGNTPEDFPDYVDVAASGPAQINDYANLGYEVIRLEADEP